MKNEKLEIVVTFTLSVLFLPAGIYYLLKCQRHIEE